MKRILQIFVNIVYLLMTMLLVSQSSLKPLEPTERARVYTRAIEFDYFGWALDAMLVKNVQAMLNAPDYMSVAAQREIVFSYLDLARAADRETALIDNIYANPDITDPAKASASLNANLESLTEGARKIKPLAEEVIQRQVSDTTAQMGLTFLGQPLPPVLYHATSLPDALIISPRNVIRQDRDISLQPGMTTAQIVPFEAKIEKNLDVSTLVVPIGGVGIYPTMVMNTTDLSWLVEVVSHEWTHNFLTLRPLGWTYSDSPEMRTVNETTASISGKEIGREVLRRYYPEYLPPEQKAAVADQPAPTPTPEDPNAFHFTREMHTTRVKTDALLAQGKISEAENYMEARRRVFWEHGYQIRRLNQAYFAFYGAYADSPGGGAAGQDPVGPAVQDLRAKSRSLADFLNRISWVTTFDGLRQELRKR